MKFVFEGLDGQEEVPEDPCQCLRVPRIQDGARSFNQSEEYIPSSRKDQIFYCHQDEICTRISINSFDIIGSDDATTCIILLLRCLRSNKLFVTHISNQDSVMCVSDHVQDFIDKGVVGSDGGSDGGDVEVYLSGGIDEDDCLACLYEIIRMIRSITLTSANIHRRCILKLCNVATLNCREAKEDSGRNSVPIVQGMAFRSDISTCVPCHFLDHQRGPDFDVRMFASFSASGGCDNDSENNGKASKKHGTLLQYDGGDGAHIDDETGKFVVRLPSRPMLPQNFVLAMTDLQILSCFSTTPWTERSRFSNDVRSVFQLAGDSDRLRALFHQAPDSIRKWRFIGITGNNEQQWQLDCSDFEEDTDSIDPPEFQDIN